MSRKHQKKSHKTPTQKKPSTPKVIPASFYQKNLHIFLIGLTAIFLALGVLNVCSLLPVLSLPGFKWYAPSDMAGLLANYKGSFVPGYIGNIILGLTYTMSATIGVLYLLKHFKELPYYDMFIAVKVPFGPSLLMGMLGISGAFFQIVMHLFCCDWLPDFSFGCVPNWSTWLILVLSIGLIIVDIREQKRQKTR